MASDSINVLNYCHLLVGGTTGSGKSVFINNILYDVIKNDALKNKNFGVVLIDPKGCELIEWAKFPQVMRHADTVKKCVNTLNDCVNLMERRFKEMKKNGLKTTNKGAVYIIIDEWIDLKIQAGKKAEEPLIRIMAKGRAARVFVILATQRPTSDVLTGPIKANFVSKVALRCSSSQESRNIIEESGAEKLPLIGYALYRYPASTKIELIKIEPPHSIDEIEQLRKSFKRKSLFG